MNVVSSYCLGRLVRGMGDGAGLKLEGRNDVKVRHLMGYCL